MAKKSAHGEKSNAIRDYFSKHRKAKARQVVDALAAQGLTVSIPMVYNVKTRMRMGKRVRKAEAGGQAIGLSISGLVAAKKLVDLVGGIKEARKALEAYAKLS